MHRSRSVPPTAYLGGGFRLFTSGGARAQRPGGGGHGRSVSPSAAGSPLALTVTLQPIDATLTDEVLEQFSKALVANVAKQTGGILRG